LRCEVENRREALESLHSVNHIHHAAESWSEVAGSGNDDPRTWTSDLRPRHLLRQK
jgi:hypothetical protein